MDAQHRNAIIQRFNSIRWHDSKLIDLWIHEVSRGDIEVAMALKLIGDAGELYSPATLIFRRCTCIKMDVDLDFKRVASDSISHAKCYDTSAWINTLNQRSPKDQFSEFLHFQMELCPPGGSIAILAEEFDILLQVSG